MLWLRWVMGVKLADRLRERLDTPLVVLLVIVVVVVSVLVVLVLL